MNALQLQGLPTSRWSFWAVLDQFCTVHAHKLLLPASNQNSDIAIRFSDPDFLKDSNKLAIRRRFHVVTLTLTLDLNVCSTSNQILGVHRTLIGAPPGLF